MPLPVPAAATQMICALHDPNEAMVTVVDVLISAINTSLPDYYDGNSSTGPVDDSTAVCQKVSCMWFKHAGVAFLQEFAGM